MKILVTGAAGFIGYHLTRRLLERGDTVIGIDSINDYYDIEIKKGRLLELGVDVKVESRELIEIESTKWNKLKFIKMDISDSKSMKWLFDEFDFDAVSHMAAQAGVRYSIENPQAYIDSNCTGFINILEGCKLGNVESLSYASSSSVYGLNSEQPFKESDGANHPVSLYAATKRANELMAHTYSHLYNLPTTGLRFFTVYGPWGRPDMALFKFTQNIIEGKSIEVYNQGEMERDFTYIDDIVDGIVKVIDNPAASERAVSASNPARSTVPYVIYNIGNSKPVKLLKFIEAIERKLGIDANKEFMPMQQGDVISTYADVSDLTNDLGYSPKISVEEGIGLFVDWYKSFYRIK